MKNVLIVEDNAEFLESIHIAIKKYALKLNFLVAASGAEAINILKTMRIAVLVTDLYIPKVDGLELLAYMSRHQPETPCIVMTAYSSPEVKAILGNLGIFRSLEKPLPAKNLLKTIAEAIRQITRRQPLEGLSTAGFLGLLQEEQRSCTLDAVNAQGLNGCFYLMDGRLYDARCGDLRGEEAAIAIIGWDKVAFNLQKLPPEEVKATIHLSLRALIAKAAGLKKPAPKVTKNEKKEASPAANLPDLLLQAIGRAESGDSRSAQRLLAGILRSTPKNGKAWLWLARTADNFVMINAALNNAVAISPDDAEIAEEFRKLTSAINCGCADGKTLDHCFFCWAPVITEQTTCHYCNAYLDIHEDFFQSIFFGSPKEPDLGIIEKSLQRFADATQAQPQSGAAHFFLTMAHINMNHWEEAFQSLKMANGIAPEENRYQRQLAILSDFMDDLESFFTQDN
jgi:CheY-like chemotaxis protein